MNHYYTKNSNLKSKEIDIYFKINEKSFHFKTDNGVFSKSGLDFGSRLLIESVLKLDTYDNVLDLGCGYGPIGIIYKYFNNQSKVTMLDINDRATDLSVKNCKINQQDVAVINNDGFEGIGQIFDLIITNPPIRTGKKTIYKLFEESYKYLNDKGQLIFVMNKQQGALSAIRFCEGIYKNVAVINKKSGFIIVQCTK